MFFYRCHAIEAKLGRAFATLKPYSLYPLADYFAGTVRGNKAEHFLPAEAGHQDPGPVAVQMAC